MSFVRRHDEQSSSNAGAEPKLNLNNACYCAIFDQFLCPLWVVLKSMYSTQSLEVLTLTAAKGMMGGMGAGGMGANPAAAQVCVPSP